MKKSNKDPKSLRIAIVGSYFWKDIVSKLEKGCVNTLIAAGVQKKNIDVFPVPGSLEIPITAKKLAKKGIYDAIIALGVIHKGKTYHFELIANECARGCMDVSLKFEIPVIFEVLAVYDIQDARDRVTKDEVNRGVEAAHAALKIIDVLASI